MEIIVDIDAIRLDRFLRKHLSGITQGIIQKHLRSGHIRCNGKRVEANHRLCKGDVVTTPHFEDIKRPESTKPQAVNHQDLAFLKSLIIWEDDTLCVINKPAGLAVQGGTKTTRHLDGLLQNYQRAQPHGKRYLLVHRLDRDTSGVWIVAKTPEMAKHLSHCFAEGLVQKTYWCIVNGKPVEARGIVDAPLMKNDHKKELMVVDFKKGKKAQTSYQLIKGFGPYAWLACTPLTGRTHQIRVHMQYLQTPIVGDGKYGTPSPDTLCLHARKIIFKDLEGSTLTFVAQPPKHIVNKLASFGINWETYA